VGTGMENISSEEKLKIIPDVILVLKTIIETKKYGLYNDMILNIKNTDDEFLKLCFYMIMNGYEPNIIKRILGNIVKNECEPLSKLLKTVQMDLTTLALSESITMRNVCVLAFSHFGMDFKNIFIDEIKKTDMELYNLFVEDDELYCLNFNKYISDMEKNYPFKGFGGNK
jgi:hypothetical protein